MARLRAALAAFGLIAWAAAANAAQPNTATAARSRVMASLT